MSQRHRPLSASTPPQKHPLQRLPSPAIHGFSPVLHFLQLSAHVASFHYLTAYPTPINSSYGWHFQYLTIFGLALSTLTALLGSLSDVLSPFPSLPASRTLSSLQKHLLFGAAAPLELLIFLLYWSLRLIDKDLVVPKWAQMPLLPDLSFHLVPAACLVLDALLLSPPPSISPLQGLGVSSLLATAYWPWVEKCARENGYYPYPIFELVGFYGRVGLFMLSAVSMAANVGLLRWAYAMCNGIEGRHAVGRGLPKARVGEAAKEAAGEPEALRQLRSTVNGTLRKRDDLLKEKD